MRPGVAKTDEGAGLFVRGGDVSETATFLDRAPLYHPYRYETPNGGLFGTVDPYLISGLSLGTGAIPARYGNVLSGVLDLTGMDRPQRTTVAAGLGLATASVNVGVPIGRRAGVRFSGNESMSRLLFAVNPTDQHFTTFPSGSNLNADVYFDAERAGRFKLSVLTNQDRVGVQVWQDAFAGVLDSAERTRLVSLGWTKALAGAWVLTTTASAGDANERVRVGVMDLASGDSSGTVRVDAVGPLGGWIVRGGFEGERQGGTAQGTTASHGGDLGGVQGVRLWSFDQTEWHAGGYSEAERRAGRLTLSAGARVDRFQTLGAWTADPRVALTCAVGARQHLLAAWGLFHQAPSPLYLDRQYGNPALPPMSARHLEAGYAYGVESGPVYVRVEAYDKQYRDLPLEDPALNFSGRGFGRARGIDVFLKLARSAAWDVWASYSFVHARRLYTPFEDYGRYGVPAAPFRPDFEIPHTLQVVARGAVSTSVAVGASLRVASGKPFTPIVGGVGPAGRMVPIFGPINSDRLPLYQRLDVNVSHSRAIKSKASVILYVGLTNLLNHENVFEYVYSADFRERAPAPGSWRRAVYFGVTVQR